MIFSKIKRASTSQSLSSITVSPLWCRTWPSRQFFDSACSKCLEANIRCREDVRNEVVPSVVGTTTSLVEAEAGVSITASLWLGESCSVGSTSRSWGCWSGSDLEMSSALIPCDTELRFSSSFSSSCSDLWKLTHLQIGLMWLFARTGGSGSTNNILLRHSMAQSELSRVADWARHLHQDPDSNTCQEVYIGQNLWTACCEAVRSLSCVFSSNTFYYNQTMRLITGHKLSLRRLGSDQPPQIYILTNGGVD